MKGKEIFSETEPESSPPGPANTRDRLLDIVVDILETEGYDAVQLREVARRARCSLSTIYKRYGTRDEMIVAAVEQWMEEHGYSTLTPPPGPDASLHEGMMRVLRTIFDPWEKHPAMLLVYFRARRAPGGDRLVRRGLDVITPAVLEALGDVDPYFVNDLDSIISSVVYGLAGRYSEGQISVTDILPTLDRTVFWLTTGYETGHRPPARA